MGRRYVAAVGLVLVMVSSAAAVALGSRSRTYQSAAGKFETIIRPRWDRVPRSVRQVTARFTLDGVRSAPVTLTSPPVVRRIVRLLNRARAVRPARGFGCPPFPGAIRFSLAFRAGDNRSLIARAVVPLDACEMRLTVGRRRGPLLELGALQGLLLNDAVPFCARHDLAFRAGAVRRHERGQSVAVFRIIDVRRVACQVDRHTTVKLLNASGQPLPFRPTYGKSASHWLIAPGSPIWTGVAYRHTCAPNRVAAVELSIAAFRRTFVKRITPRHSFAPCNASVAFIPGA